jgi:hypothetical protein
VEQTKQQNGYNSFVAHKPYEELQVDLFFMGDTESMRTARLPGQKYNVAMLLVDIFTKYTEVVPIKDKTEGPILSALMEGFNKMGGKPGTVYLSALSTTYTKKFFAEKGIRFLITRSHAGVAERQTRTIKDMQHQRMDHAEDKDWADDMGYVLLTYNHKMVHRVTGMTPYEAKKERNHLEIRHNLLLHANRSRRYPDIILGDRVKISRKRKGSRRSAFPCGPRKYTRWIK